ncbi:hypothetical protein [Rudaeicoccus suwonensis]|uniref:Heavy metal transporter n=1 Tax=Rudaeicoccus suwonensis TaxID=657409 RepID=A0A561E163_9MICO|nr:hypothetical protein [Rudaeicoccus suwonensis]TWE09343.1 hypothetical protein BKA23_3045 [Rudaeicoccus suwonensis]
MAFGRKNRHNANDREVVGLYPHGHPAAGYDEDPEPAFGDDDFYDEEHQRRGPVRRTIGCLIPLALLGGIGYGGKVAYDNLIENFGSPSCTFAAGGYSYQWDPDQSANAATIVGVGVLKDGLPERAGQIAAMTALQESKMRNLSYGDLDSLGLFQQRPSQGWGTAAQIQDPVYASQSFYTALRKVSGWQTMDPGAAAQSVQLSGFPDGYDQHTSQGQVLASVLSGQTQQGIGCRLDAAKTSATPAQVVKEITRQTGLQTTAHTTSVGYDAASTQTAWALASWAVAHAQVDGIQTVTVGDQEWQRHRGPNGLKWHAAKKPTSGSAAVRIDLAH